jgi:SAM-dependent methyltransferase
MILFYIAILIFMLGMILWLTCLIFAQAFGAPTVYSSRKAVEDALKLAEIRKGDLILDLGCGDARTLITAANKFGAKGIGVDRSPFCYLKSMINVHLSGQKNNVKIYFGDFSKIESFLPKADVVFLYLLNSTNQKIESWIFDKISEKTKVISLAFQFKNHFPKKSEKTVTLGHITPIYLYEK